MKNLQSAVVLFFLCLAVKGFAQDRRPGGGPGAPGGPTVKVTGKVIEQESKLPLEFATVTIQTAANATVTGGMTDANGQYTLDVVPGTYNIKIEFISFKPIVLLGKEIKGPVNLGTSALLPDAALLKEVEITAERSTVEIKLDKRVYTVGNDMIVRGGTISDVLDNIPSVSVDADGNVALRGNQSVTILIDGRPSSLAGSNVAEVLRLLPADSVDKVEVITNPSARYDAEGGGGIINIILKKGKANGFNGSVIATGGHPDNQGLSANLNFRGDNFNVFSNLGYNYRNNPGNSFTNSAYRDATTDTITSYTNERRENERIRKGFNASFGLEWFLDKTFTWTNTISFRRNNGSNATDTYYDNYFYDQTFNNTRYRYTDEDDKDSNVQYSTSFLKKFNENGHELKVDASVSRNIDNEDANISNTVLDSPTPDLTDTFERTRNDQTQTSNLIQADYVLPIGEKSRFEAGYRGSFNDLVTDAAAEMLQPDGTWQNEQNYTNMLNYKENVNALYSQFGSKAGKFSYLFGLRWEDSNISIDLLNTGDYNSKKYNNFFPSAFLNYEFSENSSVSLSYSRRINRPRGRLINPFSGLSSNINVFTGNPDLNPSMTNAIDLGYLKKWNKLTLTTSAYINLTDDSFQFVRNTMGETSDGTPITVTKPINLAKEYRFGLEFNANYTPFKWWRINGNANFFRNQTDGDYTFTYTDNNGEIVNDYQNFDYTAFSWSTRVNSKINLPWKIDWQLNADYQGPQNNAQGKRIGVASANTSLSKDFLKDKATLALNVQDIFNSRKMKNETDIKYQITSYSEMQWRQRQITLSFTYRFNMNKADKQKQQQKGQQDNGGDEYMGG
jgi:outer membrane receptor protein involved in Fe transport